MRYTATVTCYDYLDKIGVSVVMHSMPGARTRRPERLYQKTVTVRGTGESDERQWLIDALVALLEEL